VSRDRDARHIWPTRRAKQIQRRRTNRPKYQAPKNGDRDHSPLARIHADITKSLVQLMADRAEETNTTKGKGNTL